MSLWALERAWWRSSSFALHVGASPTHHLPINSSTSNRPFAESFVSCGYCYLDII